MFFKKEDILGVDLTLEPKDIPEFEELENSAIV